MKTKFRWRLLFGLSVGLSVWFFQEALLYLAYLRSSGSWSAPICGSLLGAALGVLIAGEEGFLTDNKYKLKKGVFWGGTLGLLSGLASFYIVDQSVARLSLNQEDFFPRSLYSLRWLIIAAAVGLAIDLKEQNNFRSARGLIGGIATGLITGILTACLSYILSPFLLRGASFIIFGVSFSVLLFYLSFWAREGWLKVLNGKLEGMEFELSKDINFLGAKPNDDIDLSSYQEARQSHAKIIRYFDSYSLVDNDPFGRTFVNFRSISEQVLKDGDVIKIGTALLQFQHLPKNV